jgi:DNA-binding FadR family transcriptional regulator
VALVSHPRVGDIVADRLRREILNGTLADGSTLPPQEDLVRQFGISRPSLREALRLLEAEGLISVRRGNVGGARVHLPRRENAAYMFGLVLQAEQVTTADLGAALVELEPLAILLLARRPDRKRIVLPHLRKLTDELREAISDGENFTELAREYHEAVVESCGSHTLRLAVGTLTSLWSAHEVQWARHASDVGDYPTLGERKAIVQTHERLTELIRAGEAERARALLRRHLDATQEYVLADQDRPVTVTVSPLVERLGRAETRK